nr:unnamed protein product [Callosobruchus analis]
MIIPKRLLYPKKEENSSTVSGQKFEEKSETFTKTMIPAELARKRKVLPFWAVPQNVKDRDTCLCEIHVNFHFLISKLKFYSIIKESTRAAAAKSPKSPSEHVKDEKWVSKKERVLIKGQEKICVKKVKETLYCNKGGLVQEFKSGLPNFYVSSFQYDSPVPNNYSNKNKPLKPESWFTWTSPKIMCDIPGHNYSKITNANSKIMQISDFNET